ncbi:hypothetical protein [Gilvimarinus agarilyticus]|uniref:hypothetical protein n=1 Tax=Gilvimarinus agarilyticus TaxID=679259 RepID=UPI0005A27C5F|nr:hypothetical protein [Gilvimarinus agarilyticus]
MSRKNGLLSDKFFVGASATLVVLIAGAILVDWSAENYPNVCFNKPGCYQYFISFLSEGTTKVAALITLSILGFYATIYRSYQTAEMLNQTEINNTFRNYLEHKNNFYKLIENFNEKSEDLHVYDSNQLYGKCFPSNSHIDFSPIDNRNNFLETAIDSYNEWIDRALIFCQEIPNDLTTSEGDEHDEYISLIRDFLRLMLSVRTEPNILIKIDENYIDSLESVSNDKRRTLLENPIRCIKSYQNLLENLSSFCMINRRIDNIGLNPNGCPLNVLGENIKEREQDFVPL